MTERRRDGERETQGKADTQGARPADGQTRATSHVAPFMPWFETAPLHVKLPELPHLIDANLRLVIGRYLRHDEVVSRNFGEPPLEEEDCDELGQDDHSESCTIDHIRHLCPCRQDNGRLQPPLQPLKWHDGDQAVPDDGDAYDESSGHAQRHQGVQREGLFEVNVEIRSGCWFLHLEPNGREGVGHLLPTKTEDAELEEVRGSNLPQQDILTPHQRTRNYR